MQLEKMIRRVLKEVIQREEEVKRTAIGKVGHKMDIKGCKRRMKRSIVDGRLTSKFKSSSSSILIYVCLHYTNLPTIGQYFNFYNRRIIFNECLVRCAFS